MRPRWVRFADRLRGGTDAATTHAQNVWQVNVSDTTAAFEQAWKAADSPVSNLHDAATTVESVDSSRASTARSTTYGEPRPHHHGVLNWIPTWALAFGLLDPGLTDADG